ncbi:hypothetical protein ACF1DY_01715 [Streptomyces albus]
MNPKPIPRLDSRRTEDNLRAVETAIDYLALPVATLAPRPDAVHVTVTDAHELNRWRFELGGVLRPAAPSGDGAVMLTLHTKTPTRADGSAVAVRVHAIAVEGEDVLIDVRRGAVAHA